MYSEDPACIRKLSASAKQVLEEGLFIGREPQEKRVGLWNEIRRNKDRFLNEECGVFFEDMDRHFKGVFDAALLCLSCTFSNNDEDIISAREMFTPEEKDAFSMLENYRSIEIYSESDLKTKLIQKDRAVLDLFRRYYLFGNEKTDEIFESPKIRNSLKFYFHKKWSGLKKQIGTAASSLILEVDYLVLLIRYWEDESRRIADLSEENARLKAIDQIRRRETEFLSSLSEKDEQIKSYQNQLSSRDEKIRSMFAGIENRSDENSRYVTLGEAKRYEMNFIERIDQKFTGEITLENKKYLVKDRYEEISRYAEGIRAKSNLDNTDRQNIPLNRRLKFLITEKKLFGKKDECLAFAAYLSRPEIFSQYGFDTQPLGLREVNAALDEMLHLSKQNGKKVILCLASPTGFDEACLSYIDSDTFCRNFSSHYLSVCFMDIEKNQAFFNRNDSLMAEFSSLCNMELPCEAVMRIKGEISSVISCLMGKNSWAEFDAVISETNGDFEIVKNLFYEYAAENQLRIKYVPDVGLVMM